MTYRVLLNKKNKTGQAFLLRLAVQGFYNTLLLIGDNSGL